MTIKPLWPERVRDTYKLHQQLVRENRKHKISDTARILHRATGSVCEDIMLASWLKTHPKMSEMKTMQEALDYVKDKKDEMRIR